MTTPSEIVIKFSDLGLDSQGGIHLHHWISNSLTSLNKTSPVFATPINFKGRERDLTFEQTVNILHHLIDVIGKKTVVSHNFIQSGVNQKLVYEVMQTITN